MESKIQKWGNSDGIRIPKTYLDALDLKTNDKINLTEKDNQIIITKIKENHFSLKEEFAKYNGTNCTKEYEWDDQKGKKYGKRIYTRARRYSFYHFYSN